MDLWDIYKLPVNEMWSFLTGCNWYYLTFSPVYDVSNVVFLFLFLSVFFLMEDKHNLFMEIFLQFHLKFLKLEVKVIVGNAYDAWMILNIYLNKSIKIDTI